MKTSGKLSKGLMVLLIAVFFLTVWFVPAIARMHGPTDTWRGKGMERQQQHQRSALGFWRNPQLVQELDLTDDQLSRLRDSEFASREEQLKLKAQLDGYRLEMEKAFSGESIDDKAVRQLAEKMADVKGNIFVQNVESRLSVGKILNADQINKLKSHKRYQMRNRQCKGGQPMSGRRSM